MKCSLNSHNTSVYSSNGEGDSVSNHADQTLSIERFTVSTFFDCTGRNNAYKRFAPYLGGCPAGRIYCNIQPNGNVTPCMFMPEYPVAGNLRKQSFEDIWNGETFQALRDRHASKENAETANSRSFAADAEQRQPHTTATTWLPTLHAPSRANLLQHDQ